LGPQAGLVEGTDDPGQAGTSGPDLVFEDFEPTRKIERLLPVHQVVAGGWRRAVTNRPREPLDPRFETG
jgi:hypothetical protein